MISFKDRIIDLTGSLGTADDNALKQWILDGCYDVITKQLGEEALFAINSSTYTAPMSVSLANVRRLVSVERNGLNCRRVSADKRRYVDPSDVLGMDSIHKAVDVDPVFYILSNTLHVKPNPTISEQGRYSYIPEYSVSNFTTPDSSIDNFPNVYYEHVIIYASILTLGRQLIDLISDTAPNSLYSLDSIRNFINGDIPDDGGSVFDYLIDEDDEMSRATIEAMSSAVSITKEKYKWYQEKMQMLIQLYSSKFPTNQDIQQ